MARHKNVEWKLPDGATVSYDAVHTAVLMDIRDELQTLNGILQCPNFQDIPRKLDRIRVTVARLDKRVATKVPLK